MRLVLTITLLFSTSLLFAKNYQQEAVPGEWIVKLKNNKSFEGIKALENFQEFSTGFGLVKLDPSDQKKLNDLLSSDSFEYIEPNYIYTVSDLSNIKKIKSPKSVSSDPLASKLWGLSNTGSNEPLKEGGTHSAPHGTKGVDINAYKAWKITKGSKAIKIAVIDTGVDYNHPDLRENMWVNTKELNGEPGIDDDRNGYIDDIHGYDFANNDGDPMDGGGHGTHCAGTIAAAHDNGHGIKGVMAKAQIVALKFLTDKGSGTTDSAIRSIDYAIKAKVDIMSNSWRGGGRSQALLDAIKRANRAGILFVAAAGNSKANNDKVAHYPSNYKVENVIGVAAHNYADKLASFSCYGANTVHVAAPGRNILSTTPKDTYAVYSGTSMAAPHVSGILGLFLSQNAKLSVKEVKSRLMKTSVYGGSYGRKTIGGGRVDAYNLFKNIIGSRPVKPDHSKWRSLGIKRFESAHPYADNYVVEKSYHVKGAKFLRLIVKEYDIEKNYDFLNIIDKDSNTIESISGKGTHYSSDYVEGETLSIKFISDKTVSAWGFLTEEIQYIK